MNVAQSKSVQRLIQLGVCQPSDIKRAMIEAEKLSTPENSLKIRKIERTFGLLGDSNRIKILFLLSKREMCVCEIEAALKLPQPTVSHHLGLLEQSDLLQRSKRGKWVFYKVNETPLVQLVQKMIEAD